MGMLNVTSPFWQTPFWEGLAGLLLSPGRGLFIYSPIFLLSLVGLAVAWISGPLLFKYMSIGPVLAVLLYSRWSLWWGGWSYGPRLLAELAPFLCLFLYFCCTRMGRWRSFRAGFTMLAFLSIGGHVLGAFWYDHRWDSLMGTDLQRLWQWSNSPLVYYAKEAFVSGRRGISSMAVRLLRLPTSETSPQHLAAAYTMKALDPGLSVSAYPCGRLHLSLEVVNKGKVVWLAHRQHRGAVHLAWRWLWEGQEVPGMTGWEAVPYHLFPGQRYVFSVNITPPAWPSDYVLEARLISVGVPRFIESDQDTDSLKMAIRVVNPVSNDFESTLTQQGNAIDDPPQLRITTDQRQYWLGDLVRVMMTLENAAREHPVDAYFAVVWPDGRVSFQDHSGSVAEPNATWRPLIKDFRLTKGQRINQPLVDLQLPLPSLRQRKMPSGCYTCYLILTELNTYQVITVARALFSLEL